MPKSSLDLQVLPSPGLKDAPVLDLMCSHFVLTLAAKQGAKFNVRRDLNGLLSLAGLHLVLPAPSLERLREFLLKGGFLWADDFWGSYQWDQWVTQIRKVLPASDFPIVDLPLSHPMLTAQFVVREVPQIPNIGYFIRSGGWTSEQGADSTTPHARIISDETGRAMVLMTHNTDIADSWEREGDDPQFFFHFSPNGYAVGLNAVLYSMSH